MNEIIFDSASEIARRIRSREISALEVTKAHLARIYVVNPSLNAVVTRCDDMALERARAADVALAKGETPGPLHGVPVTIEDAFDNVCGVAGIKPTSPSRFNAAVRLFGALHITSEEYE